jgi:uncharacterized membrane protein YdbT with pleckstrin-like domain
VVIALFGPISRLIRYFFTRYTIDDERLLVESGWLKKEKLEIPLATISSVDMTQNLLFQLTHVYGLQLENAGSISGDSDGSVKLILGKEDAELAKRLLLAKKMEYQLSTDKITGTYSEGKSDTGVTLPQEETGQTLRASIGEVLTMSVFQINWFVIAIQMVAYISLLGTFLDQYILTGEQSSTEMLVDFAMGVAPVMIAGMILGAYLISVIISTVMSTVKYYNFRITNREDSIHIEYGLFTRKSHTLMKEKISGIKFQQSLVMRAMKKGTLQIFVTGYGGLDNNNQEETVLLYPIVEEKKIYPFLNWLMPGQIEVPEYETAPARGLPYFFISMRFIFAVILMAGCILVPGGKVLHMWLIGIAAVILMMTAGSVVMEYKTSAVAAGKSMVTMNYGGYRKHIVMINRDKLEYVEDTASLLKRRRKNLSTLTVGVLAPGGMSSHSVRNMDISVFNNVKEKLIY